MQFLNSPFWRDAHCADKKGRFRFNDDVNELRECPTSVVLVSLPRVTTNLRQKQVNAKGGTLVNKVVFQDLDGVSQCLWCETHAPDTAKTTSIRHSGSQLWPSSSSHACEHHRVLDSKQLCQRCLQSHAYNFWSVRHSGSQ